MHSLMRCQELQTFPWCTVDLVLNAFHLLIRDGVDTDTFWNVAANDTVGVLNRPFLPTVICMAVVDWQTNGWQHGVFTAVVNGHGFP